MSSVQTSQLISLLISNVLMVIIVIALTITAWFRWHWVQVNSRVSTGVKRRRCRRAYVSFVLTVATLLGTLTSLGMLTLRAMVAVNALVMGAMGLFLFSVITLLCALGLWFVDLCWEFPALPVGRRSANRSAHRKADFLHVSAMALPSVPRFVGSRRQRSRRGHSKIPADKLSTGYKDQAI